MTAETELVLPPDAKTTACVALCLETLTHDPRTADLAEAIPTMVAMARAQTGDQGAIDPNELADMFQAVHDAWTAACAAV